MLKGSTADELLAAVRTAFRGEPYLSACHAGFPLRTLHRRIEH